MATLNGWKRILNARLQETAQAGIYWQYNGGEWGALTDEADHDGLLLPDILRMMGLRIADTSTTGAVHIGV